MTDDASRLFDLSETPFLAHVSATYPQPQILCLCPPPQKLLSCVISTLHRKLCKQELHKMCGSRDCTSSGPTSAPPCRLALLSKIRPSLKLRSCRHMNTGSGMPIIPSDA